VEDRASIAGAVLAVVAFLYWWVTLTPFQDLGGALSPLAEAQGSNIVNQIVAVGIFGAMLALALASGRGSLLLGFRGLLLIVFAWLAIASVLGGADAASFRRLITAFVLCICANVFLLLPRTERQFAGVLAVGGLTVMALCYFGVAFMPMRAIHQASDFSEPLLAGDWRGIFDHKNAAAAAMVVLVCAGLYVANTRSKLLGWSLAVLATFFLVQTGGKTSLGMLPFTLLVAWIIERSGPFLRWIVVLAITAGYSLMTLGTLIFPQMGPLLEGAGIDGTFTGRTDIWSMALEGIRQRLLFGHGFENFWGGESLVYGFREVQSWAVVAPTAHNSYLDITLTGGLVGLALVLLWLVVVPMRNIATALATGNRSPLTRLFIRVWVFGLVLGHMESVYFAAEGGAWFFVIVAVIGLELQARVESRQLDGPRMADAIAARPLPA
jgi:O-antigen ligase